MTQYKRIGIDTSKAVFTLHAIDLQDRPVLRTNLRRAQLLRFFKKLPPTEIALEACGGGHHWARELSALGHAVHLIPPQYVKPYVKRAKTIPGVGPIIALTLAAEIDPDGFESGRHLAAWAGLTPKEHSTGGKQRMGGISRAGNERLRTLFVSGATLVINAAMRPDSRLMTEWLRALLLRKPRKLAAVGLANKMARTAWAIMKSGEVYRRPAALAGAVPA